MKLSSYKVRETSLQFFNRITVAKFSCFALQTVKLKQPKELFGSSRLRMFPFASIPKGGHLLEVINSLIVINGFGVFSSCILYFLSES